MNRRHFLAGAGGVAAYSMFGADPLQGAAASPITVAATGDCILSRRVSHLKDQSFLGVVQLLHSADCAYGNCELVMAAADPGYPTAAGSSLSVVVDPKMSRSSLGSATISWARRTTTPPTTESRASAGQSRTSRRHRPLCEIMPEKCGRSISSSTRRPRARKKLNVILKPIENRRTRRNWPTSRPPVAHRR